MPRRAAIIGGGPAGAGWAARFLLAGWDVALSDIPETLASAVFENARRALPSLSDVALPAEGQLSFHADAAAAVPGADWIQVALPDGAAEACRLLQAIQTACPPDAIVGLSNGVGQLSVLQDGAPHPGQVLSVRAFDPVYLLPLVEVLSGAANSSAAVDRAVGILSSMGMYPLHMRAGRDGTVTDRLLKGLLRDVAQMMREGEATPAELHAAIQYGPLLDLLGTGLSDPNNFGSSESVRLLSPNAYATPHTSSPRSADQHRDETLVTLLRGLKARDAGAGKLLNAQDRRLDRLPLTLDAVGDLSQPVPTLHRAVPLDWTDYNGHMTEARYLHAFGEATDRLMALIGCDMAYVASGVSFFTAETHIRHLDEVRAGIRINITTQVLLGIGKKMHLFHRMYAGDRLLATGEHMLIHVSLTTRKACLPDDRVALPLTRLARAHADLPWPEGAGRAVGRK